MKRLILLAGVLGAMALMLPAAAQDAEEYAIEAYVTDSVNLRSGPGVQYPAVAVIPGGSPVILHGCLEGWVWCDLTWSDFRGWVSGKFVAQEYESQPITVVEYGPALEIPIIAFGLATYWDRHYHHRHFYRERDRWDRYWVANPVRPPVRLASPVLPPRRDGWRDGRGPDWRDGRGPDWRDGRGPDWRDARRPDGRGPDWRDGRGPDGRGPDGRGPDWRDGRRTPDGTGPTWRTPDGRDGRMPQAVPGTQGQPPGFMPGGQQRTPGGQPGARQATPGVPGQQPGFVPGGQQRTPGGQPGARQATPGVPGQQPGFVPGGQQRFPGGQPGARQAAPGGTPPGGTFNQPNMPSHVQRPP
ncbi:MAG: SH3 domain-containing protein, partial [Alphaproteobacteria bacterium]